VSSVVRLLEFLGSTVRLDEASLADLERLKASMRRLASQLSAMQRLNPATLNPATLNPKTVHAGIFMVWSW